jgi:hypothetical protein
MMNPIPRSGLFTFTTLEDIAQRIEGYSEKEKAAAYLVMMLTMNACHKLVEEQLVVSPS